MVIVVLNYLECSDAQFEEATKMARHDVPVSDFPTDLLYIAYTKYNSDARRIDCGTSYAYEVYIETARRRNQFKEELIRRGVQL